jgi:ApaG protein
VSACPDDVRLDIRTAYMEQQSEPAKNRYVFSYTITIANEGDEAMQLLERHWIVTSGDGEQQEVRGSGVVGQQPRLVPGTAFRYTSGTVLTTEVGTMQGSYTFVSDSGLRFDVPIPPFRLAVPDRLH